MGGMGREAVRMSAAGYLEAEDGAKIYYEDRGTGRPIVLVHGWTCSSRFWRKNVPELEREFRVVTPDLRGHGNSSKTLTGHTIGQYARDVRRVIEQLGLQDTFLAGWSMGGPVVLSYYRQYAMDSRLKAIGLVDTNPFPFSAAEWNSHALRNYNYDGMHAMFAAYAADRGKFAAGFTERMFQQKPSRADVDWIVAELLKTPAWIALAAYSDYLMSDLSGTLASANVPVAVFAANSDIFPSGIAMGKALAGMAARGTCVPFEDAGHLLFYEQAQKFNAALAAFMKGL
jgi:pimeloyl-ACP methyl ester carboxylesterase